MFFITSNLWWILLFLVLAFIEISKGNCTPQLRKWKAHTWLKISTEYSIRLQRKVELKPRCFHEKNGKCSLPRTACLFICISSANKFSTYICHDSWQLYNIFPYVHGRSSGQCVIFVKSPLLYLLFVTGMIIVSSWITFHVAQLLGTDHFGQPKMSATQENH